MPDDPRPLLLAERCSSCIFRPGNLMRLRPGRLAEVTAANRGRGTLLICHQTLADADPGVPEAMCRGYWDAYAPDSSVVQVMQRLTGRLDWYREVPPPTHADEDTP